MNSFTLSNFKKTIPSHFVTEGEKIYKRGDVKKIVSSDGRDWKVDVTVGKEVFNVEISIDLEKSIVNHFCDCPSETTHCNHQVAALLKLKEVLPSFKAGKTNKPQKEESAKKKKPLSPIELILNEVTELELHTFIKKSAAENKIFQNLFLIYFADKNENNDRKYYGEILKNTIANLKRSGSLNRGDSKKYVKAVEELSATANDAILNLKYKDFAPIALAFIETLAAHLKRVDDSENKLHTINQLNFKNFVVVAQKAPHEIKIAIIKELFEAIDTTLSDLYNNYRVGLIEMLSNIGTVSELKDIYISFVEKNLASGNFSGGYWSFSSNEGEKTLVTELIELARKYYETNNLSHKVPLLLAKHTDIPKYCKEYLNHLFDVKNYEEAKKILEQLLFKTSNSSPSLSGIDIFYLNKMDEIYEKLGDVEGKINALKLKFRLGEFKQFSVLEKIKALTDKTQWDVVFKAIEKEVMDNHKAKFSNFYGYYRQPETNKKPIGLGHLYVADSRWDELGAMVKKNNDLESYATFCDYLLFSDYENTFDYFKKNLQNFLKDNTNDANYPFFVKALKSLHEGNAETKDFAENLLQYIIKQHTGKKNYGTNYEKMAC